MCELRASMSSSGKYKQCTVAGGKRTGDEVGEIAGLYLGSRRRNLSLIPKAMER